MSVLGYLRCKDDAVCNTVENPGTFGILHNFFQAANKFSQKLCKLFYHGQSFLIIFPSIFSLRVRFNSLFVTSKCNIMSLTKPECRPTVGSVARLSWHWMWELQYCNTYNCCLRSNEVLSQPQEAFLSAGNVIVKISSHSLFVGLRGSIADFPLHLPFVGLSTWRWIWQN